METQKIALLKLNLVKGIGPNTIARLESYLGDISLILEMKGKDVADIPFLTETQKRELLKEEYDIMLEREIAALEKDGALDIVTFDDPEYPRLLRNIPHPPRVLYVWGDKHILNDVHRLYLGVVGTRAPNAYGHYATDMIVSELASAGVVIVSGLAIGIDTLAHKAALERGQTIAVLGSGLKKIYPSINREIAEKIAQQGAVVSEFPLFSKAVRQNFPQRNRIISGISSGVLVIQAPLKSGALITVEYALEQGRDVFAVPGNINSPVSVGTNNLIKEGAMLVSSAQDILDYYEIKKQPAPASKELSLALRTAEADTLDQIAEDILEIIKQAPMTADQIFTRLNRDLKVQELQKYLIELELSGLIKRYAGGRYVGSI